MGDFLRKSYDEYMEGVERRMAFADDFIYSMNRFQGVPYVYGGPRNSMAAALAGTDCSGSVIAACEAAVTGCTGGASYTGDMRSKFLSTGLWEWHAGTCGVAKGDVLLYDRAHPGHTAAWDGSAIIEEYPPQGRRTGWYEYDGAWDGYLRYVGPGSGNATENEGTNIMPTGEPGTYTVVCDVLNVRDNPSLSANVVASYTRGETVYLEATEIYAEGYLWGMYTGSGSGAARYVAICKVEATETYLEA